MREIVESVDIMQKLKGNKLCCEYGELVALSLSRGEVGGTGGPWMVGGHGCVCVISSSGPECPRVPRRSCLGFG